MFDDAVDLKDMQNEYAYFIYVLLLFLDPEILFEEQGFDKKTKGIASKCLHDGGGVFIFNSLIISSK